MFIVKVLAVTAFLAALLNQLGSAHAQVDYACTETSRAAVVASAAKAIGEQRAELVSPFSRAPAGAPTDLIVARTFPTDPKQKLTYRVAFQLGDSDAVFDKAVRTLAKNDPTCRLLMSVPGIGVVTVLAYVSMIEDPARFARSRSVGAHIGLTPRQYQSGEVDRSGRISRCGDTLARTLMYEAAVVILSRVKKASGLKDWAQAIAKRSGIGKARVALARKLCTILHSIWRSGQPFRWSAQPAGA